MTMSNTYYRTCDLALAAALACQGYHPEKLESSAAGRATFVYNHSDDLELAVRSFWTGEALIEPQTFNQHYRTLKSRIYND
jgi:hypothetical protein